MFVTWKVCSSSLFFFQKKWRRNTLECEKPANAARSARARSKVSKWRHINTQLAPKGSPKHTHTHTRRRHSVSNDAHQGTPQPKANRARTWCNALADMRPQLSWSVTTKQLDSVTPVSSTTPSPPPQHTPQGAVTVVALHTKWSGATAKTEQHHVRLDVRSYTTPEPCLRPANPGPEAPDYLKPHIILTSQFEFGPSVRASRTMIAGVAAESQLSHSLHPAPYPFLLITCEIVPTMLIECQLSPFLFPSCEILSSFGFFSPSECPPV